MSHVFYTAADTSAGKAFTMRKKFPARMFWKWPLHAAFIMSHVFYTTADTSAGKAFTMLNLFVGIFSDYGC